MSSYHVYASCLLVRHHAAEYKYAMPLAAYLNHISVLLQNFSVVRTRGTTWPMKYIYCTCWNNFPAKIYVYFIADVKSYMKYNYVSQ